MSNTSKVHLRFWDAMRARFGMKWITDQGEKPTAPWVALLDRYTPDDLRLALEVQAAAKREWPPSLDEFAAYLAKASAQARINTRNFVRDFWRSVVVSNTAHDLQLTHDSLEPLVAKHRATLGASMKNLLDELESMEAKTGQRTIGMFNHATTRCREIAYAFAGEEPGDLHAAKKAA